MAMTEQRVTGGVLLVLGALALVEARRLSALREEMVAGAVVGDDTFPLVIGCGLLAAGVHVLALARWPAAAARFPVGLERRRLLGSAGVLVGYYLVVPYLGYTLGTLAAGTALYGVMGGYRWPHALLLGALTSGALYLMFRVWLLQPLPTGWVGF